MIPTSAHNEALSGDTLYSAFLNHEWREIVVPIIVAGLHRLAATIEDESERQDFEVLYGALIDDLYNEDVVDGIPVGMIIAYADVDVPAKYLLCNGAEYDQDDYPELYALLLGQFNDGSESAGHFRIPNLVARFPLGSDGLDFNHGLSGGEVEHTLTIAEMPTHHHEIEARTTVAAGATRVDLSSSPGTTLVASQSTGGGEAHNNMPPWLAITYIIKALP